MDRRSAAPRVAVLTTHDRAGGSEPDAARQCLGLVRGALYARVSGYLKDWYFDYGAK